MKRSGGNGPFAISRTIGGKRERERGGGVTLLREETV